MIENGEIKREDIIVQTKVTPAKTNDEFRKTFDSSWKNMSKIGYIDLFSFHGLNNGKQYDWVFQEGGNYTVAEELLEEGKIKHVGFSTHGTPDLIRKTIETDKMEYVNLHYHYFGSYHSSFYEDGEGGHGNAFNVQLAKSKDMGVFIISPVDKGGALYSPTRSVVNAVYPLSPIGFQSLWLWEKGCDTISIGISKVRRSEGRPERRGSKINVLPTHITNNLLLMAAFGLRRGGLRCSPMEKRRN
jgi:predicted aldo/keto reductase-like oxidoreductase